MKKLFVSLCVAFALVLPTSAASASDPPVGVKACPYGYYGVVVYHYDPHSGYTYIWACFR
jgi:hypothetical protein